MHAQINDTNKIIQSRNFFVIADPVPVNITAIARPRIISRRNG